MNLIIDDDAIPANFFDKVSFTKLTGLIVILFQNESSVIVFDICAHMILV